MSSMYFTPMPFLSTPSARRATEAVCDYFLAIRISIHALREEGDSSKRVIFPKQGVFLSTPSARRATRRGLPGRQARTISIHALREEGDLHGHEQRVGVVISIHALREEGD